MKTDILFDVVLSFLRNLRNVVLLYLNLVTRLSPYNSLLIFRMQIISINLEIRNMVESFSGTTVTVVADFPKVSTTVHNGPMDTMNSKCRQ